MMQNHSKAQNMFTNCLWKKTGPTTTLKKNTSHPLPHSFPALDSLSLFANLSVPQSSGGNIIENDPTLGAQQTPAVHQVHRVHCPSHGKDFPSKTRHLHRALEVNMLQILSSRDRGLRLKVSECCLVDFDQRMLQV